MTKKKFIFFLGSDIDYDNKALNFKNLHGIFKDRDDILVYGDGASKLDISVLEEAILQSDENTHIHFIGHGGNYPILGHTIDIFEGKETLLEIFLKISSLTSKPVNLHISSCFARDGVEGADSIVDFLPDGSIVTAHGSNDTIQNALMIASYKNFLDHVLDSDKDALEIYLDSVLRTLKYGAYVKESHKKSLFDLMFDFFERDPKDKMTKFTLETSIFDKERPEQIEFLRNFVYSKLYPKMYEYFSRADKSLELKSKHQLLSDEYINDILDHHLYNYIRFIKKDDFLSPKINISEAVKYQILNSPYILSSELNPANVKILIEAGIKFNFSKLISIDDPEILKSIIESGHFSIGKSENCLFIIVKIYSLFKDEEKSEIYNLFVQKSYENGSFIDFYSDTTIDEGLRKKFVNMLTFELMKNPSYESIEILTDIGIKFSPLLVNRIENYTVIKKILSKNLIDGKLSDLDSIGFTNFDKRFTDEQHEDIICELLKYYEAGEYLNITTLTKLFFENKIYTVKNKDLFQKFYDHLELQVSKAEQEVSSLIESLSSDVPESEEKEEVDDVQKIANTDSPAPSDPAEYTESSVMGEVGDGNILIQLESA